MTATHISATCGNSKVCQEKWPGPFNAPARMPTGHISVASYIMTRILSFWTPKLLGQLERRKKRRKGPPCEIGGLK